MPTTYDTVRYIGSPFAQTHPVRLATLATLFGLAPADVNRCRVLEIGCGDGGNLIPIATNYPQSKFVGVDLAASAVDDGNAIISELALKNAQLHAMNLMDITPDFGEFDYIIAHGVFAWVPRNVQDKLLSVASRNLAPNGVAYISYNAYPGAHLRHIVRDMMLYFLGDRDAHEDPVKDSVPFLKFITAALAGEDGRREAIKTEITDTLERTPFVVYHDELADSYTPVYFHEFVSRAAACGLQFLSEAQFPDLRYGRFSPELSAALEQFSGNDRVRREQLWDFIRMRKFRATLLVHSEVKVDPDAALSSIPRMYATSGAAMIPRNNDEVEFRGPFGATLTTKMPAVKTALAAVIERWPESVPFSELLESVQQRTATTIPETQLADILLASAHGGLLQLEAYPAKCLRTAAERPSTNPLARLQAQSGAHLTTQRHTSVDPGGDIERYLVTLIDGTRGRKELLAGMKEAVETDAPDEVFAEMIEKNLEKLADMALLVS